MSSWCDGQKLRYNKPDKDSYGEPADANFLPELEYEYFNEEYMRAWGFSWGMDQIRLIEKTKVLELTAAEHSILKWYDTNGGEHIEDGRKVPYVDCTTDDGLTCANVSYDDIKWVTDYEVTVYDFKTRKKKKKK